MLDSTTPVSLAYADAIRRLERWAKTPAAISYFRASESAFLGSGLFFDKIRSLEFEYNNMCDGEHELYVEIVIDVKPYLPVGDSLEFTCTNAAVMFNAENNTIYQKYRDYDEYSGTILATHLENVAHIPDDLPTTQNEIWVLRYRVDQDSCCRSEADLRTEYVIGYFASKEDAEHYCELNSLERSKSWSMTHYKPTLTLEICKRPIMAF